jgi:pimeloyl-ACP methyl ester carboxylesterase
MTSRTILKAYTPSRYGQLHYRIATPAIAPTAPPLLCLHQTPGNSRDWLPIIPQLAQSRIVIAADTPGYGMSDAPPEPASIEELAAVMAQLMDDLAPGAPFDVMGFHTGSAIATELAASLPDRVRRMVVFGLAAFTTEVRDAHLTALLEYFPAPADNLDHVEKLWAVIQDLSDSRIDAETKHRNMGEYLRLGSNLPWGYISVFRYDFLEAITKVAQPVLIMNPEDDLWENTLATAHRFQNGRRYDLRGVKHGVLSIETDRIVAEITGFLDS